MEQNTQLGTNKTGIDMSPIDSKKMLENSGDIPSDLNQGRQAIVEMKNAFLADADPLGSVPLPGTIKGVVKSTLDKMTGHNSEVFINKLGERLAFERTGVRVYEQLIIKCRHAEATGKQTIFIPIAQLEEFRAQEAQHFELLINCFNKLGADPTAQTPDADATSVSAAGMLKVIADPRTSVSQCLQAILSLELIDNVAWELLAKLANNMGLPDMVNQFNKALREEDVHLENIRNWYEESIRTQATSSLSYN